MKTPLLFLLLACAVLPAVSFAQQADSLSVKPKKEKKQKDSTERKLFELSFGQSLLFISNSQLIDIRNTEAIVIPTSAMLFFTELRPMKRLHIPVFVSVPTETKQFLIAGQLVNERASPTFGTGLQCKLFEIPVSKKACVELEIGPLASFLFTQDKKLRFAPIGAGRVKIIKERNFVMYVGSSYSIGINAWGLFYGTGFIF
jgi:hypothetical protein